MLPAIIAALGIAWLLSRQSDDTGPKPKASLDTGTDSLGLKEGSLSLTGTKGALQFNKGGETGLISSFAGGFKNPVSQVVLTVGLGVAIALIYVNWVAAVVVAYIVIFAAVLIDMFASLTDIDVGKQDVGWSDYDKMWRNVYDNLSKQIQVDVAKAGKTVDLQELNTACHAFADGFCHKANYLRGNGPFIYNGASGFAGFAGLWGAWGKGNIASARPPQCKYGVYVAKTDGSSLYPQAWSWIAALGVGTWRDILGNDDGTNGHWDWVIQYDSPDTNPNAIKVPRFRSVSADPNVTGVMGVRYQDDDGNWLDPCEDEVFEMPGVPEYGGDHNRSQLTRDWYEAGFCTANASAYCWAAQQTWGLGQSLTSHLNYHRATGTFQGGITGDGEGTLVFHGHHWTYKDMKTGEFKPVFLD